MRDQGYLMPSSAGYRAPMVRLTTIHCPRCGANLPLEPEARAVTCAYCGTKSHVDSSGKATASSSASSSLSGVATLLLVLGLVGLIGFVAIVVGVFRSVSTDEPSAASASSAAPPSPSSDRPAFPEPPSPPPAAPAPTETIRVLQDAPLFVVDVNGDGRSEVVAPIERALGDAEASHYAVFNARDGAQLARTPPIEGFRDLVIAAVSKRLVIADRAGKLSCYDLVSGDAQWSTVLGERVGALCAADAPDSVLVETDARRLLSVDLLTGRQSETRARCLEPLARTQSSHDPRDRRDYDAPRGTEAYRCGGVTVMGSANFRVADQCLARGRVDTNRLDGMVGHRIWRHGRGWLVFGVRTPGTYVPMVGLLSGRSFVWKSEVPLSNPLEAEEGGPRQVALRGEILFVAYATGQNRRGVVTAFRATDGARLWTFEVPDAQRVRHLVASDDGVVVQAGDHLYSLAAIDGARRVTL